MKLHSFLYVIFIKSWGFEVGSFIFWKTLVTLRTNVENKSYENLFISLREDKCKLQLYSPKNSVKVT